MTLTFRMAAKKDAVSIVNAESCYRISKLAKELLLLLPSPDWNGIPVFG